MAGTVSQKMNLLYTFPNYIVQLKHTHGRRQSITCLGVSQCHIS